MVLVAATATAAELALDAMSTVTHPALVVLTPFITLCLLLRA